MTIIYVTENNTKRYGVICQNSGCVKVQKFEDVFEDKNIIHKVNHMEIFLGKSQLYNMTDISGAEDKEIFNGNTILLKIGEKNNRHRYVYIGGDMVCSFLTNDRIYNYISNMGNNSTPYSIAIGWEYIYYLTPYFKFIKKEYIDVDDIDKLFDIDYHNISNYQRLKINKILSNCV